MSSAPYATSKAEIEGKLRRSLDDPGRPLPDMKWLSFHGMGHVRTLEPLAEFPWLEALEFDDCTTIPDLSVIERLPALDRLVIRKGRAAGGGAAIQRHPGIRELHLCAPFPPGMDDVPPHVEHLRLNDEKMTAPPPWAGLARVRRLSARASKIPSLELFPEMPALERLEVNEVKTLASCAGLARFPKLEALEANFTAIGDLAGIGAVPALRELRLRKCPVSDLSPAFACRGLRTLYAEKTRIRSVGGIAEAWPELDHLWIWDTKVKDLEPLRALTRLRELELALMKPKSWDFLTGLRSLETLDVSDSTFTDLGLLADLPALRYLRVSKPPFDPADPGIVALDAVLVARGGGLTGTGDPHWKRVIRARHAAEPEGT